MAHTLHTKAIVEQLRARKESIAVAESLTGGGVGHALTHIPGASEVFLGGVIAYTAEIKVEWLGVSQTSIDTYTVVSEEVAREMAAGVQSKFGTTWGIATTGIAGPQDYEGIRAGTVWIAIAGPVSQTLHLQLDGGREQVREGAISSAIGTFARILSM